MGLITRTLTTSKVKILHPKMDDFDLTIEVRGRYSKCYYNLLRFQQKQAKLAMWDVDPDKPITEDMIKAVAQREEQQVEANKHKYAELLADFIVDWSGVHINQPYSKEAAVQLMEDDDFYWIRNQLSLHIREDQNFFPAADKRVEGESKVDSGS